MEADSLTNALSPALDEAAFDLERTAITSDEESGQSSGQRVSAEQFRETYLHEKDRSMKLYARANVTTSRSLPLLCLQISISAAKRLVGW